MSSHDSQRVQSAETPLPGPVAPRLSLAEEVVLLSMDAPRRRVRQAVRLAATAYRREPGRYRAAVGALRHRGLVTREGPLRHLAATPKARHRERYRRLMAIVTRPAAPEGRDAELLVLVAYTGELARLNRQVHVHARLRISSIGVHTAIPPLVETVKSRTGAESMAQLAERLLPAPVQPGNTTGDPGVNRDALYGGAVHHH